MERDHFTFTLPTERNVEFAISYVVEGKQYWDNNNGKNYIVRKVQ